MRNTIALKAIKAAYKTSRAHGDAMKSLLNGKGFQPAVDLLGLHNELEAYKIRTDTAIRKKNDGQFMKQVRGFETMLIGKMFDAIKHNAEGLQKAECMKIEPIRNAVLFKTITIYQGSGPGHFTIYLNYFLPFRFGVDRMDYSDMWDSKTITISIAWFRIWISRIVPGPQTDKWNSDNEKSRKAVEKARHRRKRQVAKR